MPDLLTQLRRGELAGARELRLPGGLTEFPREIFGLADTLEVLDLSGGSLTRLPDDLGRLRRLRVLFCSGNRFARLPPALGDCPALSQIGFRGTGLREVPGEALPPSLRWLTLTDNAIETLPSALGERPHLQKVMLAGNRLRDLPAGLAGATALELIRLAANRFDTLPPWLVTLPRLAWINWAANPFERVAAATGFARARWGDVEPHEVLGEGASGRIHRATWRDPERGQTRPVALKLFKGAMTSDGLPEREMAACLTAGAHPHLTGALGRLVDHPEGADGLLMPLLPPSWRVLAGPPSLASCSRDVYDPALRLSERQLIGIARSVAGAAAHLHERGLLHGDLYAHNILWDRHEGEAVLSDFGASSNLPDGGPGTALQKVEVRAFGILLSELLALGPTPAGDGHPLEALRQACEQPDVRARPLMSDVAAVLDRLGTDQELGESAEPPPQRSSP